MDTTVDLDSFSSLVERPGERARQAAAGRLGLLETLGDWLAAVRGGAAIQPLAAPMVLLFAGDHQVASLGVSRLPAEGGTAQRVRAVLDGSAPVALLARRYGAEVRVVDVAVDTDPGEFPEPVVRHRVRRGSGRIDIEDALTPDEVTRAFRVGVAVADEQADAGTDLVLLGDLGAGSTTVAAVLIGALCGTDAAAVTGRGSGIDDRTWMVKCATVRDALRRARPVLGDQLTLLGAVGGADFAAITGFLLQASVRKLPVVLDGVVSAACALVAQRVAFRAPEWWRAAQSTGEPAQAKAYDRLILTPLQELSIATGEGVGAVMALPLLQAASDTLAEPSSVRSVRLAAEAARPRPKLPTAAELLSRT